MSGLTRRALAGVVLAARRLLERAARVPAHAGAGNPAHRHLFRESAVRVRVERPEDRLRGRSHERDRPSPRAHARVRRHAVGDDPAADAGRPVRRHRGRHHHHAGARAVAGLVDALHDHDAQHRGRPPRSPQIRSIADLRSASVGVQAATTDYDIAVRMQQKGQIGSVKVYSFDRIQDAMVDLAAGRITAVMKVYPVAAWLARQTADLGIVAAGARRPAAARHRLRQGQSRPARRGQSGARRHEARRHLRPAGAKVGRALTERRMKPWGGIASMKRKAGLFLLAVMVAVSLGATIVASLAMYRLVSGQAGRRDPQDRGQPLRPLRRLRGPCCAASTRGSRPTWRRCCRRSRRTSSASAASPADLSVDRARRARPRSTASSTSTSSTARTRCSRPISPTDMNLVFPKGEFTRFPRFGVRRRQGHERRHRPVRRSRARSGPTATSAPREKTTSSRSRPTSAPASPTATSAG